MAAIKTLADEFNGSIDDANIKSGAAINPTKIAGGTAGMLGAWPSWAPTWANLTVGNGTVTAKYIQLGKTILFHLNVLLGPTSAVGTGPSFTLPATSVSYGSGGAIIGWIWIDDTGVANYQGPCPLGSTTTGLLQVYNTASTYLTENVFTASVPMAWGTGDSFTVTGMYEAA